MTRIETVTLNPVLNGPSDTTVGGGRFSFLKVARGPHVVAISSYPSDASFTSTSQPATITTAGQTATLNFTGTYISQDCPVKTGAAVGLVLLTGCGTTEPVAVSMAVSGPILPDFYVESRDER